MDGGAPDNPQQSAFRIRQIGVYISSRRPTNFGRQTVTYRPPLPLAETDQARANLLDRLATEAEHGVLCTLRHHLRLVYSADNAAGAKAA